MAKFHLECAKASSQPTKDDLMLKCATNSVVVSDVCLVVAVVA